MQENALNSDYREYKRDPIDDYEIPKSISRFGAAAIDLALYLLLSLIIFSLLGLFMGKDGTDYSDASNLISEHIGYSKLANLDNKNGYVSFTDSDLLALDADNKSVFIDKLSYFYCSYLTGENVEDGYSSSLEKDKEIVVDAISYLPKDYYTVSYFNENILELPKAGESEESPFFAYQKEGDNNDYTKIGVVKESFIGEVSTSEGTINRIKNDNKIIEFLRKKYDAAIKTFYDQSSIKKASDTINKYVMVMMLVSSLPSFAIFYIVLPLTSKFGKTLGKRFLSLVVVTDHGYQVKKWQLLIRTIPILGATIYVCLINNLYFQLALPILLLLISLGFLVFNNKRRCLHDIMSATTVIYGKNIIVYPDEDKYEQALSIIKEREQARHE